MEKEIVVRVRAVIIDEGKLLVVKHAHGKGFAALPGGHLEWGENVKQCLEREIVEELGVRPEIGRLLYINHFTEEDRVQSIEFFFEISNSNQFGNLENLTRTHAHELAEILWVEPNDSIEILPKEFGDDFKSGKVLLNEVRYLL